MSDFLELLRRAEARIEHGNVERSAGADDRARVIDAEVARRGRGGAKALAAELNVSEKTVSQAVARARTAGDPRRRLPHDTLDRLLAAELRDLPPLPAVHWQVLAWIVRGMIIDVTWLEDPGTLLSYEVEDLEEDVVTDTDALAAACRSWSRAQALAVIDAILHGDDDALPTKGE
ncbi:hypothetical protein ACFXEL_31560 [Streptomyces sp. NPDC059382]|uniref:hypothetical protein n=1 Tax=Streptomyces sp. NPDC059382 TaxID=3346816 RepID=UPI0036969F72